MKTPINTCLLMVPSLKYFIAMNDLLLPSGLRDVDDPGKYGLGFRFVDEYDVFFQAMPMTKLSNRPQPYCEMY